MEEKQGLVYIEDYPNDDFKTYYLKQEFSHSDQHYYSFSRTRPDYQQARLATLKESGIELLTQILQIPGAKEITVIPKGFRIQKSKAFLWDEIEPAVIKIINGEKADYENPPPKIVIERVGNEHLKCFHMNTQVSTSTLQIIRFCYTKEIEEIGEIGVKIIQDIRQITGCSVSSISPYEVSIEKEKITNWQDVEPLIVECLKKCFGEAEVQVTNLPFDPKEWEYNGIDEDFYDDPEQRKETMTMSPMPGFHDGQFWDDDYSD